MSAPAKRVFHYNASAHAYSGQFTRPIHQLIEVQAATSASNDWRPWERAG